MSHLNLDPEKIALAQNESVRTQLAFALISKSPAAAIAALNGATAAEINRMLDTKKGVAA